MHPRPGAQSLCVGALIAAFCFQSGIIFAAETDREEQIALGKKTAQTLCQSCHLFTDPSLLDKETWIKRALPYMKPWLGLAPPKFGSAAEARHVNEAGVLPQGPILSDAEWVAVNAYFYDGAPAEPLVATNKSPAKTGLNLFRARPIRSTTSAPATTLVSIDTNRHGIFVGDAQDRTLKLLDAQGETLRLMNAPSAPVDVVRAGGELWVPLIGRIFPSDEWVGQVRKIRENGSGWEWEIVLSGLPRIAHISIADLDHDGKAEIIGSAFGYRTGKLMMFKPAPANQFGEKVISPFAGTIATHVEDLDADGLLDILALHGQAREGVFAYLNRGDHFEEKPVIEFPPTHGTCRWQVLDFNRDGKTDLLICNGDAGEYPGKPRAYHGVRLYLGEGNAQFKQAWSYPLNGAYGARAADFDGDGDLDIVAISFFADYKKNSAESFVYFENKGNFRFEPFTFSFANEGRWLVMDAGDIDGDGDVDVALGSFVSGPRTIYIPEEMEANWKTNRVSVLLLENTTR